MRKLVVVLVATGAILPPTMVANAQAEPVPSLLGEWQCDEAATVFRDGEWSTAERTIDVVEQQDALFRAINYWAVPEETGVSGHQDGQNTYSGSHTWLGVIGYDNSTFRITSYDDGHIVQGWILDEDTIGISAIEPGENAWVSRSICRRISDG